MSNGLTRDTGQEGRDLPAAATENNVEVDTLEAATSTCLDESVLIEKQHKLGQVREVVDAEEDSNSSLV